MKAHPHIILKKMGRGKLGGTKAKIRGKVGTEIYQVKRDTDGLLIQHVYQAPESREYTNTEAQARARMIMGQIERMFHILPNIIKYAFKTLPSGTMCFQHFSRMNYELLRADMQEHWESSPNFDWRPKYELTAPAGIWKLTDGILPAFHYDYAHFSQGLNNDLELDWHTDQEHPTIGELYNACGMQANDKLLILFYVKPDISDLPYIKEINCWLNPCYDLNTRLEDTEADNVFLTDSNWDVLINFSQILHEMSLSIYWNEPEYDYMSACAAFIIIRNSESGTKFSSSYFEWLQRDDVYGYRRTTPQTAFYSWQTL